MADVDLWVNENKIKVIGKHHIFLTDVSVKLIEEEARQTNVLAVIKGNNIKQIFEQSVN